MGAEPLDDIYAQTLAVFTDGEQFEPLTTPEVAGALNCKRRTVYQRLERLVERGKLETKKTGSNSRVWWRPPSETASSGAGTQSHRGTTQSAVSRDGRTAGPETAEPTDSTALEAGVKRWSEAMQSIIDGVAIIDASGAYVYVNQSYADIYGYDGPEAFLGESWEMCYGDDERRRFRNDILPMLRDGGGWRGEATGKRRDGSTFTQELSVTETEDCGIVCVVRDITDRKKRERRLREARQFNEELVENAPFGMFRLDEQLRITYENPRAEEIIGLPEDRESSDAIGADISELPPIVETGQSELFKSIKDGCAIEFDFPFESIYGKEAYFTGRAVPVYRDDEFDGAILMATDISERRQYERELERQRKQLAALDELNDVVRGITEAVIDQSTREEIEQVVRDRLTSSDSYRIAWTGAADGDDQLDMRVAADIDGFLDAFPLSPAPEAAAARGPIERALETQAIQVVQHAQQDPPFDALGDHATAHGYRALAIIPISHQGVLYGLLGICTDRSDAFAEAEREVVGQLGDIVGHAIAAVDRKRALMSDEVIELELRIPELLSSSELPATDGTVTIDRVTPVGDETFLMYGQATDDAIEVVRRLNERLPGWDQLDVFTEQPNETRFEQQLSDTPVATIVADYGGNFTGGAIEAGSFTGTVQLPVGTDIRWLLDVLKNEYPDIQVVRQQQVRRGTAESGDITSTLAENLTDRQRVVTEAAYFGGYFDSPRLQSGEDIAESLGIRAATFHQHVRKAERKLFELVFTEL
ncbi:PAS domain S-box protein [Halomicroarcula sp. F28]|uniref:PAS domain S-box protein n=1 Tax=Haloarcula salinisoli TaxID=2487746 RepID=UPI001C72F91B|nr:bacterio-opsin activator domain-containing protein [Halomicroarcula salinisoli]MBX0286287.1 PAS domain S-box protein [Halomicroarcula salinisoli]